MSSALTVRDIDPGDKSWFNRETRHVGVSMEEFVRRIIREKCIKTEQRPKPSEVFGRYFGRKHGVELPPRVPMAYKPVEFTDETGT